MSSIVIPQTNRNRGRLAAVNSKTDIVLPIARKFGVDISDSCGGNPLSGQAEGTR